MSYRVLIVDDFEPWRRHVASTLAESSRWQIVGDASDGLEAIERAADLRPDLSDLQEEALACLSGLVDQAYPRSPADCGNRKRWYSTPGLARRIHSMSQIVA